MPHAGIVFCGRLGACVSWDWGDVALSSAIFGTYRGKSLGKGGGGSRNAEILLDDMDACSYPQTIR